MKNYVLRHKPRTIDRNGGGGGDTNGRDVDYDTIDPATRLILEKARTTRSRPVEDFRQLSNLINLSFGIGVEGGGVHRGTNIDE